ncbi:2-dehydro-3-deoxygalactonokinase [Devosia sp. UYZn731]|uniref:2-dehydro-3-deoxygalactonokinase n=1 Tax=Devosia sp. UYZn731 TaxID=3156345 RepID=UPI003396012B
MYIAIEWTSAAFHAWQLQADGSVLAEHSSARGVNSVSNGAFDTALRQEIGPWLGEARAILLSGMVTSRTGWIESPFVMVPAGLPDLLAQAVRQDIDGLPTLYFLPGIARQNPVPDVMRGEELAVFGIGSHMPALVVLPGAHSKWITTDGSQITDIATYMGGEVLSLLKKDSLVSRLIPASYEPHPDAFERGTRFALDKSAMPGGVLQRIFSARSLVLFGRLQPAEIADYLGGIIAGSEISEALAGIQRPASITVMGTSAAAAAYRTALEIAGIPSPVLASSTVSAFAFLAAELQRERI